MEEALEPLVAEVWVGEVVGQLEGEEVDGKAAEVEDVKMGEARQLEMV